MEGETSSEATVDSGVSQGTVLRSFLFLCQFNDLPEAVTSQVRLFAAFYTDAYDHCPTNSNFRNTYKSKKHWPISGGWKCYVLSIKHKLKYMHALDNTIIKSVLQNSYLYLMLSEDLKWSTFINNTCGKAS